jgi:hypothetical protein
MVEREFQFKIRLSGDEVRWLTELAEQAGVTKTDYLRLLLRREGERLAPASVKPKIKRK